MARYAIVPYVNGDKTLYRITDDGLAWAHGFESRDAALAYMRKEHAQNVRAAEIAKAEWELAQAEVNELRDEIQLLEEQG